MFGNRFHCLTSQCEITDSFLRVQTNLTVGHIRLCVLQTRVGVVRLDGWDDGLPAVVGEVRHVELPKVVLLTLSWLSVRDQGNA